MRVYRTVERGTCDSFRVEGAASAIRSAAIVTDEIMPATDALRRQVDQGAEREGGGGPDGVEPAGS